MAPQPTTYYVVTPKTAIVWSACLAFSALIWAGLYYLLEMFAPSFAVAFAVIAWVCLAVAVVMAIVWAALLLQRLR